MLHEKLRKTVGEVMQNECRQKSQRPAEVSGANSHPQISTYSPAAWRCNSVKVAKVTDKSSLIPKKRHSGTFPNGDPVK